MFNPCVGWVTSEHENDGGYRGHWGRDIGCATGDPVYAAFGGVIRNIVRWSFPGNRNHTWAPYKTGNGARVINTDGAVQGYNHVRIVPGLKDGDRVTKGQLIGHVDLSGNTTGPHLHFETWSRDDPNTHFSPKILYDRYGVQTGDLPNAVIPQSSRPTTSKGELSVSEANRILSELRKKASANQVNAVYVRQRQYKEATDKQLAHLNKRLDDLEQRVNTRSSAAQAKAIYQRQRVYKTALDATISKLANLFRK